MPLDTKRSLRSFFNFLCDFIYPPLCLSCQRLLESGCEYVCPECWHSIQVVTGESPIFHETRDKLVASGVIDDLLSAYVFEKEGAFQAIVHNLKYAGVQALGLELGRRLARSVREKGTNIDALIPIPLHRRKLRERGYNQAELIARGISEVTGILVQCDVVRRKKYTKTQTLLSLNERRENMGEAFEVVAKMTNAVRDKEFLVIDDVVTTGSTMVACAAVLRASGARRVLVASAALAE